MILSICGGYRLGSFLGMNGIYFFLGSTFFKALGNGVGGGEVCFLELNKLEIVVEVFLGGEEAVGTGLMVLDCLWNIPVNQEGFFCFNSICFCFSMAKRYRMVSLIVRVGLGEVGSLSRNYLSVTIVA